MTQHLNDTNTEGFVYWEADAYMTWSYTYAHVGKGCSKLASTNNIPSDSFLSHNRIYLSNLTKYNYQCEYNYIKDWQVPMHIFTGLQWPISEAPNSCSSSLASLYSDSQNWVNVWCFWTINWIALNVKHIRKVLVHQRNNLIRAMQALKSFVIPIRGDEDMGNSNQGPIDSVLWEGTREIVSCNFSTWYCPL